MPGLHNANVGEKLLVGWPEDSLGDTDLVVPTMVHYITVEIDAAPSPIDIKPFFMPLRFSLRRVTVSGFINRMLFATNALLIAVGELLPFDAADDARVDQFVSRKLAERQPQKSIIKMRNS